MGTSPPEVCAIVLRAPGNVEKMFNALRSSLYARTGAASTHGLPPWLPLVYCSTMPGSSFADSLPQVSTAPIELGGISADRSLTVSARLDGPWAAWRDRFDGTDAPSRLPDTVTGFFLGASDAVDGWFGLDRPGVQDLVPEVVLPDRLAVLTIACVRIRVLGEPWWHSVDWDVVWARRVKLRGQIMTT